MTISASSLFTNSSDFPYLTVVVDDTLTHLDGVFDIVRIFSLSGKNNTETFYSSLNHCNMKLFKFFVLLGCSGSYQHYNIVMHYQWLFLSLHFCPRCINTVVYVCIQYIPRNMHTVFALLCFVVVIHLLIFPYPSGSLHWHCGNLTIAPVPAKQPWWIWINTSCEFIMNDCITTTKQSTTKPCAYFLGYTVFNCLIWRHGYSYSLHLYFILYCVYNANIYSVL